MKKLIHILTIILSVSTFACQQNKDYPEAIQRAKSCMDEHPDSALQLLTAYADSISTQPEETRMYYHLLTHQAKDKLYMKSESDSLINRIVAFYDETDDKDKQMLAYYYQGSVYRDLNDAPRALKAFQQVLQLGEGYPPCDLFARTYNQMGTLCSFTSYILAMSRKAYDVRFFFSCNMNCSAAFLLASSDSSYSPW